MRHVVLCTIRVKLWRTMSTATCFTPATNESLAKHVHCHTFHRLEYFSSMRSRANRDWSFSSRILVIDNPIVQQASLRSQVWNARMPRVFSSGQQYYMSRLAWLGLGYAPLRHDATTVRRRTFNRSTFDSSIYSSLSNNFVDP
jgi:hypothetical protein